MPAGLPVALALLAEAAAYGPDAPARPRPVAKPAPQDACATPQPNANTREIVICAQRPNGYRLDPDVMEAKREAHEALAGRLKTPAEKANVDSSSVGPWAGYGAGSIDLLAVAIGAVTMAKRLAEGKEIGSMFITEPQPDEYQRYLLAKYRREAREAAAAAAVRIKAARSAETQATPTAVEGETSARP